jgi:pectinesterase
MTRMLVGCSLLLALVVPVAGGGFGGRPPTGRRRNERERADIVVARDGSGDVRTIQEALDRVPPDNAAHTIILVRNGTYQEKLFIRASHVSIVGEDRDRTRVEYAELRKIWRETHPDDWGAATVNIGDAVTDVILANLTIRNNYGELHGDHDHQFAIRSGGDATRITLLDATVAADGGDTLSLWNPVSGMYYHANCAFEGWVDYVCPRSWCYITNSRFFGHNLTASIWHDGSKDPASKLVIRSSRFDGVPGFPLGRNNRDGQFFLLDASFSSAMADRAINRPSPAEAYFWPPRVYYSNCQRDGGDYAWFRDNLDESEERPRPQEVTARWTFGGRWDPENTLPSVLARAAVPQPDDGARLVEPGRMMLRWIGGRNATKHRLSLGPTNPPPFRQELTATQFDAGALRANTAYYWRVDTVTPSGIIPGPVWRFTTSPLRPSRSEPGRPAATSRTKAGDDSRLPPPPPVRILLIGDSTVTDDSGWGRGFRQHLSGGTECLNLAQNGRSSRSYIAEGHWAKALAEHADYVLIQFGHNDMPGKGPERETDPGTTYKAFLGRYVDEAREVGIKPVLVTSLVRRHYGPDGRIASDLGPYVEAARQVAEAKNVPLIDLHARSIEVLDLMGPEAAEEYSPRKADGTPDRTHLTPRGSAVFGGLVAEELKKALPGIARFIW